MSDREAAIRHRLDAQERRDSGPWANAYGIATVEETRRLTEDTRWLLDELAAAREELAAEKRDRTFWAVSNSRERQHAAEREAKLREALLGMVEEVETLERHGRLRGYEHLLGVTAKARAALANGEGET